MPRSHLQSRGLSLNFGWQKIKKQIDQNEQNYGVLIGSPGAGRRGMNREGVPGKSPEEMYIQQKVRVLLMLRKMGSNLTASEEEFLRTYAGVVNSQLSQLPQHSIDQGAEDVVMAFSRSETEDRRQ
ncbi:beta-catenin-interacting protein 1 isoform X3 [Apteryx rowi]|uniref:beta-catenin-interacting protein 1 isoform X3 n=1 Tax=Apteryx rowi TaxID=308060 RepID=UPI000E1C83E2|nr:beta-catenin-interacting protein 1 isoform X3 [Apteryx rowi]